MAVFQKDKQTQQVLSVRVRNLNFSSPVTHLSSTDFNQEELMRNLGFCLGFEILKSAVVSVDHAQGIQGGSERDG